ncbi:hypothetical protein [Halobaculum sp. MBLA0143]|uniref:hypothetical protein n=1 Tax=Halobaculum sp. MBLA0143 TaxID=3079933 RepID=UPI003525EDEB
MSEPGRGTRSLSHPVVFLAVYIVALGVCIPGVSLVAPHTVGVSFDTAGPATQLATLLSGWAVATVVALGYLGVEHRLTADEA